MSNFRIIQMLLAIAVLCSGAPRIAAAADRPNIVLILSDDMGFSDLGCYGGEIRTPNLDRLAAGGVRFTRFYNTARCCPTRAALLTGLYSHRTGVGHMMEDHGQDAYRGDLNSRCVTIAEALKLAGYGTYMTGKWHVTRHKDPQGPKDNWPLQRGFDRYYGTITGAGSYYDPATLVRDNTMITAPADPEYRPARYYYTDAISDHAVRFIGDHAARSPDRPFFLYVAYTAAHWPLHAPEEDVRRYKGIYNGGYGPVRARRFERLKELGLIDPRWPLSPKAGNWDAVEDKAWEARCMEVYAAMVDRMDQGIGRIVEELKTRSLLENTLILYLQDNGACAESMWRTGVHRRGTGPTLKPLAPDEVLTETSPRQTRDGWPMLQGPPEPPGGPDTYVTYGKAWANVSNTPFREYKHWVHEGGISTPLIAHWPRGIGRRGALERQPGHLVDIMATCLDVACAGAPRIFRGREILPPDGTSLRPALDGGPLPARSLFFEHEGNRAASDGRWKLVAKGKSGPWELYDLEADRTEMIDLAARWPDRVREMAARWDAWARDCGVLPMTPWDLEPGSKALSAQVRFELKAGDRLERGKAPAVAGRAFTVTARIIGDGGDGVLAAQGGNNHGWSLYLEQGCPRFAVRRARVLAVAAAAEPIKGEHEIAASLSRDGRIGLSVDGRAVATAGAGGPIAEMPTDGLEVGCDLNGPVGPYRAPHAFGGRIISVRVELEP